MSAACSSTWFTAYLYFSLPRRVPLSDMSILLLFHQKHHLLDLGLFFRDGSGLTLIYLGDVLLCFLQILLEGANFVTETLKEIMLI
jgi:hypothetical protein